MAIPFVIIQRVNPRQLTQPKKFFGLARSVGEITLRDLAVKISSRSTVSTMDIHAVLEGFLQVIPEELSSGHIVRLGEFGTMRSVLQSQGSN